MNNREATNGCLISIGSISLIMCITLGAILFVTDLGRPESFLGLIGYAIMYLVGFIVSIPGIIYFAFVGAAGVPVGPEYVIDHLKFWVALPIGLFLIRELVPRIPVIGGAFEYYMLYAYGWTMARLTFKPFETGFELEKELPRSNTALKREIRRKQLAAELETIVTDNKRMKMWLSQQNIEH